MSSETWPCGCPVTDSDRRIWSALEARRISVALEEWAESYAVGWDPATPLVPRIFALASGRVRALDVADHCPPWRWGP